MNKRTKRITGVAAASITALAAAVGVQAATGRDGVGAKFTNDGQEVNGSVKAQLFYKGDQLTGRAKFEFEDKLGGIEITTKDDVDGTETDFVPFGSFGIADGGFLEADGSITRFLLTTSTGPDVRIDFQMQVNGLNAVITQIP